eukprot:CAMPEP_0194077738 /NCGR_PEP_ID=MMETSP0149-20130528/4311_1 /TAXON_ID=122233 /ORGANISM="Chaetoceros debilis, Strain MM31A-1" /LENGTH=571 /DNA_ID=CAMNT_0038758853 /DNA_START=76 /DNA_END=1788 /DNA_ORIENTATION=-
MPIMELEISLAEEYAHVAKALEEMETQVRIQHIPSLEERAPPLEADDLKQEELGFPLPVSCVKIKEDDENIIMDDSGGDVDNDNDNGEKKQPMALAIISKDGTEASLKRRKLKTFSMTQIQIPREQSLTSFLSQLTYLNVSQNELMDLPGLSSLPNLTTLNLERNWFNTLPSEIGHLHQLQTLNASRNFLRPNASSLQLTYLQTLPHLTLIDLLYNQKCGRLHHRTHVQSQLPQVQTIKMTLWEEVGNVPGTYVGSSAAERNPLLLRSQLEPLGTVALRRRLVQDFGQRPTDAAEVDRAGVMSRLLEAYTNEGWVDKNNYCESENKSKSDTAATTTTTTTTPYVKGLDTGIAKRKRVHLEGTPVPQTKIDELLIELRGWTARTGKLNKNRERPSIQASNYMILRSPKLDEGVTAVAANICTNTSGEGNGSSSAMNKGGSTRASRRAVRKAKKLEQYRKIWDLAMDALHDVDEVFAERCTEIAVTFGFTGSPHRDKQNCGPFYGFAMGDFPGGQGGICVEASARVVAVMNTKNRLGRVDGRYVHWVDSYDKDCERYSLIYYETGNDYITPGP